MTQIEQQKEHAKAIKADILQLLGWDEERYCFFQYEQGLEYLYEYLKTQAHVLEGSRIFWNWWKNQWTLRDQELLRTDFALTLKDPSRAQQQWMSARRLTIYLTTHDGCWLASEVYPSRAVMEESYKEMVHQVAKEAATQHPESTVNRV